MISFLISLDTYKSLISMTSPTNGHFGNIPSPEVFKKPSVNLIDIDVDVDSHDTKLSMNSKDSQTNVTHITKRKNTLTTIKDPQKISINEVGKEHSSLLIRPTKSGTNVYNHVSESNKERFFPSTSILSQSSGSSNNLSNPSFSSSLNSSLMSLDSNDESLIQIEEEKNFKLETALNASFTPFLQQDSAFNAMGTIRPNV